LIAELKYPDLEPRQRKEILEQMESILAESELESEMQEGSSTASRILWYFKLTSD
jgi:hypothetical protein